MHAVGEDRREEPAGDLVEGAEHETCQDGPCRPHEVPTVGSDVYQPEGEGGDHEAELRLECAPEEGFLAQPGEDRDQHEPALVGAVYEARGELLCYLPQDRENPVSQEPERYR